MIHTYATYFQSKDYLIQMLDQLLIDTMVGSMSLLINDHEEQLL